MVSRFLTCSFVCCKLSCRFLSVKSFKCFLNLISDHGFFILFLMKVFSEIDAQIMFSSSALTISRRVRLSSGRYVLKALNTVPSM